MNAFSQCKQRNFDISIAQEVSTNEILAQFAKLCSFALSYQDEQSREKLELFQTQGVIKQMSLDELFKLFIVEKNLHYDFDGKVLRISRIKTQTFKLHYISSVREGQSITKASVDARSKQSDSLVDDNALEDNVIKSLEKFDFWEGIKEELIILLQSEGEEAKTPIINQNTGLITISGTPKQLERVQKYIQNLSQRLKKQVAIDVNIIAVSLDEAHSSGINWQNFSLSFNTNTADNSPSNLSYINTNSNEMFVRNLGFNAGINLSSIIDFLNTNGKTKVLSSPKLVALNNQQAIISVGDTINYQVRESTKSTETGVALTEVFNNYSIFVGILLNILPEISDDGKIMLRISPSLSNFKYPQDNRRQDSPRTIAPDTVQKKLSTVVQMENNQTLILGGLISSEEATNASEVKGLAKIPLLGRLFRGKEQSQSTTEIVFVIKPLIIENSQMPSLRDFGFNEFE